MKVVFDFDLAELYGVEIRALNQAVKRNKNMNYLLIAYIIIGFFLIIGYIIISRFKKD